MTSFGSFQAMPPRAGRSEAHSSPEIGAENFSGAAARAGLAIVASTTQHLRGAVCRRTGCGME